MRKKLFFLSLSLVFGIIFFALQPGVMAGDPIEIKAATWHPVKHRLTEDCFKLYGKEVEKRTKGKVKFKWFLGGSLVQAANSYKSLQSGLVDVVMAAAMWASPDEFPITNAMLLPFIADSSKHASKTFFLLYQNSPEFRKEYKDRGVVPIGFGTSGVNNIHVKGEPPKTKADMKGRKLTTPSGFGSKMLGLLGATPVVLKIQDMYMGMQRGMADGCLFPDAPTRSYKFTDFLNGHTIGNIAVGPHVFLMTREKWDSLPPDVQKVFKDLTPSLGCLNGETLKNEADWVNNALKKRGDKFYYLPAEERAKWKQAVQPLYAFWAKKLDGKGLDGKAIIAQIEKMAEKARKNPCQTDSWWGRAGKK